MKVRKYRVLETFCLAKDLYKSGEIIYIDEYCEPTTIMNFGGHKMFRGDGTYDGRLHAEYYDKVKKYLQEVE